MKSLPIFKSVFLSVFLVLLVFPFGAKECAADTYYADPVDGNDSNPGTLAEPWKTVAYSMSQLSPGDTLYLRDGIFYEDNVDINTAGTEANPINIKNYPDEVPIIDGGYLEFRDINNSDWEVYDSGKNIYRSVNTYPLANDFVYGYLEHNSELWRLITYQNYNDLSTNNEDYTDTGDIYLGTGIFWDSSDNKIYLRIKDSQQQIDMGYDGIPASSEPNKTKMYIFANTQALDFQSTACYLNFEGVNVRYQNNALHFVSGAHHITVKDCNVLGGKNHILIRTNAHDLTFDNVKVEDSVPPWIAWSDVKRGTTPAYRFQGNAFELDDAPYNIEIKNCLVENVFDAIDATQNSHDVHIHDNEFYGIRDDCLQLGTAAYNFEVNNNLMISVFAGPSWNASGSPGQIATKYIHHNVIDCNEMMLAGRNDPSNYLPSKFHGPNGDGMVWGRAFATHGAGYGTGDPWKIYNNTCIIGEDWNSQGVGYIYPASENFNANYPHEVYNNIFIQTQDDWVARDAECDSGAQIFDGDIYYRMASSPVQPLFYSFDGTGGAANYDSLAAFKASVHFTDTQSYYAPGWENDGNEANLYLDSNYRPHPNGVGAVGAIALDSNWPGVDANDTYRGALAPDPNALPTEAIDPSPADGMAGVDVDTDLSWTAGLGATSHDVYFGTNSTPGADEFEGNQSGTTFDPCTMDGETTYYWRIDEKGNNGTATGDVWSFTTGQESNVPPSVAYWAMDENYWDGTSGEVTDSSGNGNHGTAYYDANTVAGGHSGRAGIFDGTGVSGGPDPEGDFARVADSETLSITGNLTISAWVNGELYGDGKNRTIVNKLTSYRWMVINNHLQLDIYLNSVKESIPCNVEPNVGEWQHVAVVVDFNTQEVSTYLDGDLKDINSTTRTSITDTTGDLFLGAYTSDGRYGFDGMIDEVKIFDLALDADQIAELAEVPPSNKATNPNPADGATSVNTAADLSWTAGVDATSHDVYFGTASSPGSSEFQGNQSETTFDPCTMDESTTYYWRIDEVNDGNTATGDVWSFTTTGPVNDVADSDIEVAGTVSGSYTDTQTSNDVYESIEEIESSGNPANRYSYLEHKWTIDVTGGDTVTFYIEAYKTVSSDGDDFIFAYSPNDSAYYNMVTVAKTSDNNSCQTYEMPSETSGTVYIRVLDTDQGTGNRTLDTIYIDHMYIRSESGPPPPGVTIAESDGSTNVNEEGPTSDTYTVVLDTEPADTVTIIVDPDIDTEVDSNGAGNPIDLTFLTTNWDTAQTVTVTAIDDNDVEGDHTSTITHTTASNDANYNGITIDSVIANVTDNDCSASTMHVESIICDTVAGDQGNKYGRATVTIYNNCDEAVGGADVDGTFSGDFNETFYDVTTDGNGVAVFTTSTQVKKPSFQFCVDDVTHATLTYDSNDNVETCDTN